ncbi:GntR family transcriptional regulator [Rhizocola hellebori]|uniref:GntR family transcriptional regulator n=1 Tax=Rhizocola hellebori TaxID=1392758 RepID=A0A8J3Q7U5_9ACTN|nr:PLP-dependent aminotransferase family protein [Rhizocola hellebori]GIH04982.1 GntR family transcriptional regulator [Rhizocola hellebori]
MTVTVRGTQLARLLGRWHALPARRRLPDYVALASAIRGLLADGRLPLGVRLPAERDLADALSVSRTTVSAAYRELRESGHLTSRRGAGSWTTLPNGHRVAGSGLWMAEDDLDLIDLSCAALGAPQEMMSAATAALADLPRYLGGAGYHPTGIGELRAAVADQYTARGLPTSPEQIMITNGVLHALDLVLRLLVPVGAPVLVESPTYPNALAALAGRRARVSTHGLDETGWDADLLLGSLRQTRPRLAYLIPEFQNPTGHLMPAPLREQLVATAQRAGTDLVIDESFVDLPLDGQPMPPAVASFDRHGRVLTIGGMSKPFWGGLRIGWVRASAPTVQRLAAARVGVDTAGPVLDQLVGVHLLAMADKVIADRRKQLANARDALLAAAAEHLPAWRITRPSGGVTLWAELDGPVSSALARAVESMGVRVAPGPRFGVDGTLERFLRLPFTQPIPELIDGVRRIAAARYDLDRTGSRPQWSEPELIA